MKSEHVNMKPVENVLAWCKECEDRNQYAMMNTGTGIWLKTAIAIIRQQYNEIQNARNDLIDATADRLIDNREARDAMYEWGTEHGYMLLESEIDALCVAIQQCRGTR